MFVPKIGKIGAMLSSVAILIGAGLLSLPALPCAGPEAAGAAPAQAAETRCFESDRVGLKTVPLGSSAVNSLAVAADGTVWYWGSAIDKYAGTLVWILRPVRLDSIDGVVATAGNLALKSDGTVWSISYPGVQQVEGLSDIVAVDAGNKYGLALRADGTVWQFDSELKPVQVSGLTKIVAVAMGADYYGVYSYTDDYDSQFRASALKEDGTVWTWTDRSNAEVKPELKDVEAIAAGFDHHLALKSDGTVWGWGSNTCGQTGGSIPTSWAGGSPVPDWTARKLEGIGNVTAISAGGGNHFFTFGHSLALKSDGTVWEWGCDGTAVFNPKPTQVAGLTGVLAIEAGGEYSLVLKKDGNVWGWGWNYYGQLGNGTRTYTFVEDSVVKTPVQALGLPPLISPYFNGHGQPYNNEDYSYWYNQAELQWYRGSKGGQVTPIALPPWEEQTAP